MTRTAMVCLVGTLVALPAPAAGDDTERRRVVEQKAALVQRVLGAPAAAQGHAAIGGVEDAQAMLASAARSHRQAVTLIAHGRLAEAEAALDEAMAAIGRARRAAPDPARRSAELRARYDAQAQSTRGLLDAARQRVAERPAGAAAEVLERGALRLAHAQELATAGRLDEALQAVAGAERALTDALAGLLGTTTLDYTPRFDSPAAELRHEAERFASFRRLVLIALAELRPDPPQRQLVDQCVGQAAEFEGRARSQTGRGEPAAAAASMRQGTQWLQRALAAAGLVVPTQ